MPAFVFDEPERVSFELPEHKLLMAILERAALDYAGTASVMPHVRRSAEQFFRSQCEEPWSFHWICQHLPCDADSYRERILKRLGIALKAKALGIKMNLCHPEEDV
jgi:hypothetical protein